MYLIAMEEIFRLSQNNYQEKLQYPPPLLIPSPPLITFIQSLFEEK